MTRQELVSAGGRAGAALGAAIKTAGARRVMVIASPSSADTARTLLAGQPVVHWHDEVVRHVPVEVAHRALAAAKAHDVDLLICIGGGSATGLAKAVALTTGLPIVAVPTTYAGSEMTDVWGLTDGGVKTTGRDPRALPRTVVHDWTLTVSMPRELSVVSGLNALAHAVDAFWAPGATADTPARAAEAIGVLADALPQVFDAPDGATGREEALRGAGLAARVFAEAGSGLHHKICHVLGGRHNLPHAETHAVVLPHVVALNTPGAPEAGQCIAESLHSDSAVCGLDGLWDRLRAPRSLRALGLEKEAIPGAVEAIMPLVPASNPVRVTSGELDDLLQAAWEGARPR